MPLETPNLQLLPYSPAHWLAILESVARFEEQFGLPVAGGLRDLFISGEISQAWLDALRSAHDADPWVHGFGVFHRSDQKIIGSAGFKGAPDEQGVVEIGYGIAPSYQNRGHATQAAALLVEFASQDLRVRLVRAHTLPTRNASTRVLEKCGFNYVGPIEDFEDDALVWRWERPLFGPQHSEPNSQH